MITTIKASVTGTVYGDSATYSTARTTGATAATTYLYAGQAKPSSYNCDEGFLNFDLDVLAPHGEYWIDEVRLFLKCKTDSDTTGFTLCAIARDWGDTLTTGDYWSGASITGVNDFEQASSHFAAGSWHEVTQTVDGYFNPDHLYSDNRIRLLLYSDRHKAGTTPSGNEYLAFYGAADSGSEPYIEVTWYGINPEAGYLDGALGPAAAWNRALTASEVASVMAEGQTIIDRLLDNGTATIGGDVRTRAGTVIPATHVRADGTWWLQNLDYDPTSQDRPRPLLITAHSVDLEAGRNALTVGVDWMEDEIGVKMADLLAMPEPVAVTPAEETQADPYQPDVPVEDEPVWDEPVYEEPVVEDPVTTPEADPVAEDQGGGTSEGDSSATRLSAHPN